MTWGGWIRLDDRKSGWRGICPDSGSSIPAAGELDPVEPEGPVLDAEVAPGEDVERRGFFSGDLVEDQGGGDAAETAGFGAAVVADLEGGPVVEGVAEEGPVVDFLGRAAGGVEAVEDGLERMPEPFGEPWGRGVPGEARAGLRTGGS